MAIPFVKTRGLAVLALLAALVAFGPLEAQAGGTEGQKKHHALSLLGTPKFPADFAHFDWVNPDAPKGGVLRQSSIGTFDNLNPYTFKGDAAAGLGLLYDSLMVASPDEPATQYGLVAEWVSFPDDYSSVTFKIRDGARFHDGTPITPEDVIFSLEAMKAADPQRAFYWKNVVKGEKTGDGEVTFSFDVKGNRELPFIVGELDVIPKHYWTGKDASGQPRDLTKTTLEPPLGSGAYKIKSFEAGRNMVFERAKDWWAKDLPVTKGLNNFDEISVLYFRDRLPAFESFKAHVTDYWMENKASAWVNDYSFDAVKNGQVKKEALPHKRVQAMQAFVMNLRRPQFQDIRVRRALVYAFNFEALNKSIFYDQYIRAQSYFQNSELAATGLPQGRELELLNELKDQLPPEVFTTEWKSPVYGSDQDFRSNMTVASKLLDEAGWTVTGRVRKNAAGNPLKVEILLVSPDFERIALHYIENLKKLGVEASVRVVDAAQYKRRSDKFDFDMMIDVFGQTHSPGNEQRQYWGSEAAGAEGGQNTIGIKNPAIDKLIDRVILAKDRTELVAATRALDRALLWNFYAVPNWYYPFDRLAAWDVFGRPSTLPSQQPILTSSWWIDPEKAKALAGMRGQ